MARDGASLPALVLRDDLGIGSDVPILVSRRLATMPFFQELISPGAGRRTRMAGEDERWVVSDARHRTRVDWPLQNCWGDFWIKFQFFRQVTVKRRLFILRSKRTFSKSGRGESNTGLSSI